MPRPLEDLRAVYDDDPVTDTHLHTVEDGPVQVIRQTGRPCTVHSVHKPASHVNEIHHVWPKGDGGPDIPENTVVICATGHNSVHQLLTALKNNDGTVPYSLLKQYTMGERDLAKTGYDRLTRGAM